MSTKFKHGDQVKFDSKVAKRWKRENQWYHGYPFTLDDTFTIEGWNGAVWEITFGNGPTIYRFREDHLVLAGPPLTQQDKVIQKIKYLDKRYSERKHATV